jgi:hypothetical protein
VVTRREPGGLVADLRSVDPADDLIAADAIISACRS